MKKKDAVSLITWFIIFALLIIYSVVEIRPYAPKSSLTGLQFVFFFLASLAAGVVINAFVFELAHVLGAKAGHYKVTRVNVLRLCLMKEDNKKKLCFRKYDGLTGETRIIPDEKTKKQKDIKLFAIFPTIFMLIEICVVIVLFAVLTQDETKKLACDWGHFILTTGIIGFAMLLYDIVPFEMDVMTDGYRLRLISNKESKAKINQLLCDPDYVVREGNDKQENVGEVFSSDKDINAIYKDLKENNLSAAIKKIDSYTKTLKDNKATAKTLLNAKIFEVYTKLMMLSKTEAEIYYANEVSYDDRRNIAEEQTVLGIAAYILMSGLLDKSQSECLYALNNLAKAYKHCSQVKKELEKNLFNAALEKVTKEHPKWELESYKL